jgi:hypothetical protein
MWTWDWESRKNSPIISSISCKVVIVTIISVHFFPPYFVRYHHSPMPTSTGKKLSVTSSLYSIVVYVHLLLFLTPLWPARLPLFGELARKVMLVLLVVLPFGNSTSTEVRTHTGCVPCHLLYYCNWKAQPPAGPLNFLDQSSFDVDEAPGLLLLVQPKQKQQDIRGLRQSLTHTKHTQCWVSLNALSRSLQNQELDFTLRLRRNVLQDGVVQSRH